MANKLRVLVSGDRKRFKDENANLDLSYIQENIIAMSFPASGFIEKAWRNSMEEVHSLLRKKHADGFMVFNLSERKYSAKKFAGQMVYTPFQDHHPPPFLKFFDIVSMIDGWLSSDRTHVAVIHCVGGKGRTGTIIAALMFYAGIFDTTKESAAHFAKKRSDIGRGVTQPSQNRYLLYFEQFLLGQSINFRPLVLEKVVLVGLNLNKQLTLEIYDSPFEGKLLFSKTTEPKSEMITGTLLFDISSRIHGDLYIRAKQKGGFGPEVLLFRCCLHTYFINENNLVLDAQELDSLEASEDGDGVSFKMALTFSNIPSDVHVPPPDPIFFAAWDNFKANRDRISTREVDSPLPRKSVIPANLLLALEAAQKAMDDEEEWDSILVEKTNSASKLGNSGKFKTNPAIQVTSEWPNLPSIPPGDSVLDDNLYLKHFTSIDKAGTGKITKPDAFTFLMKSNLTISVLNQIWKECNPCNLPQVNQSQFIEICQLIGLSQHGKEPKLSVLSQEPGIFLADFGTKKSGSPQSRSPSRSNETSGEESSDSSNRQVLPIRQAGFFPELKQQDWPPKQHSAGTLQKRQKRTTSFDGTSSPNLNRAQNVEPTQDKFQTQSSKPRIPMSRNLPARAFTTRDVSVNSNEEISNNSPAFIPPFGGRKLPDFTQTLHTRREPISRGEFPPLFFDPPTAKELQARDESSRDSSPSETPPSPKLRKDLPAFPQRKAAATKSPTDSPGAKKDLPAVPRSQPMDPHPYATLPRRPIVRDGANARESPFPRLELKDPPLPESPESQPQSSQSSPSSDEIKKDSPSPRKLNTPFTQRKVAPSNSSPGFPRAATVDTPPSLKASPFQRNVGLQRDTTRGEGNEQPQQSQQPQQPPSPRDRSPFPPRGGLNRESPSGRERDPFTSSSVRVFHLASSFEKDKDIDSSKEVVRRTPLTNREHTLASTGVRVRNQPSPLSFSSPNVGHTPPNRPSLRPLPSPINSQRPNRPNPLRIPDENPSTET